VNRWVRSSLPTEDRPGGLAKRIRSGHRLRIRTSRRTVAFFRTVRPGEHYGFVTTWLPAISKRASRRPMRTLTAETQNGSRRSRRRTARPTARRADGTNDERRQTARRRLRHHARAEYDYRWSAPESKSANVTTDCYGSACRRDTAYGMGTREQSMLVIESSKSPSPKAKSKSIPPSP
jgi:hypothetical protein